MQLKEEYMEMPTRFSTKRLLFTITFEQFFKSKPGISLPDEDTDPDRENVEFEIIKYRFVLEMFKQHPPQPASTVFASITCAVCNDKPFVPFPAQYTSSALFPLITIRLSDA